MKQFATPVLYPTTKAEEETRWGFDVYKPKGTPQAWIMDWPSASAGFGLPIERLKEVVEFRIGTDISALTVDDCFAGHAMMYKLMWHNMINAVERQHGEEATIEFARGFGYPMGERGWKLLQERFGTPIPLDKIIWYQDVAHLLYGPDTHAYSWFDEEKSVCTRTRCLFRPPKGMEKNGKYCRVFDDAYVEGYMNVEPDLYCVRVPDLGDDAKGPRCIHMWTYKKEVVDNLPDEIKVKVPETTKVVLRGKGVKI